jgi:hypothetical protein
MPRLARVARTSQDIIDIVTDTGVIAVCHDSSGPFADAIGAAADGLLAHPPSPSLTGRGSCASSATGSGA